MTLTLLIWIAIAARALVGLYPYSGITLRRIFDEIGMNTPPLYGDFEAQRHWMELTIHVPADEWYFYDLQYWGLDYPPLTAYHSFILGSM
jgi:alpha-1,3-glucosyltransferase